MAERFSLEERKLKWEQEYKCNAVKFITKASNLLKEHPGLQQIFDEMLHSVLFLGHINRFLTSPEDTLGEVMCQLLRGAGFDRALTEYQSKLPARTPFSCLLDMVVRIHGQETMEQVKEELKSIIESLDVKGSEKLIGSTICITSDLNTNEILTYGASLSQTRRSNKKIILAVSCLHTWHPLVSYAVMCQTQGVDVDRGYRILQIIPARCTAYNVKALTVTPPCYFCQEMFSLEGNVPVDGGRHLPGHLPRHLPGNCAEPEALSKLLEIRPMNLNQFLGVRIVLNQLRDQTNDGLLEKLAGTLYRSPLDPESIYKPLFQ